MADTTAADVLAGRGSYDDLDPVSQALVREAWEVSDAAAIARLDFSAMCPSCGHPRDAESRTCRQHASGAGETGR